MQNLFALSLLNLVVHLTQNILPLIISLRDRLWVETSGHQLFLQVKNRIKFVDPRDKSFASTCTCITMFKASEINKWCVLAVRSKANWSQGSISQKDKIDRNYKSIVVA